MDDRAVKHLEQKPSHMRRLNFSGEMCADIEFSVLKPAIAYRSRFPVFEDGASLGGGTP